jgi:hypothetical protein
MSTIIIVVGFISFCSRRPPTRRHPHSAQTLALTAIQFLFGAPPPQKSTTTRRREDSSIIIDHHRPGLCILLSRTMHDDQ